MVGIGEQLKYFRTQKKMSQKQVAKLLHVTPQTISKWELNKSAPDFDQLIALSNLYRKSIDTLLGQKKLSIWDYLADAQNFRNQFGIPNMNGGVRDGKDSSD
ncbi:helix-turn-helix transcriptional regulator [Enterococcus devriesei]|uniref:helix-turn-helix domain-containing protein n=1 Tax=Enterococcus devriesei TaxID=319970 RepID=UPI001C0F4FD9|nr:helix-turn-helix transcriptional regulator [Enterococcus devriesei]MBU5365255.1 helix-turn-helix domain-containing protein [Enterococcus devriesei]MDT2821196.1 helix-turn-helix transcriptional regulator [Enterococcus devriesei]